MGKGKLLYALDSQKGKNYKLIKQKKQQKEAAKRKKAKASIAGSEEGKNVKAQGNGALAVPDDSSNAWESDKSIDTHVVSADISRVFDGDSDSDSSLGDQISESRESEKNHDKDEDDIPLSDVDSLNSDEIADILPHQRLTINNTSALQKARTSIVLSYSSLSFSAHQSLITPKPISIADVNDDLTRELAFYKQCLDSANEGRNLLKKEGVSFSRPTDYFAEMVKSDEHMGKIKAKMTDEAANKKAAAEARKQRDLRKFGKQVQVAKMQERDKAKRDTLDKIELLKRKRSDTGTGAPKEEDLFDVALEDAAKEDRSAQDMREGPGRGQPVRKKQKKDEKFGFGGKKRFAKSTDAASTGDMRGFSAKKMKSKKHRPGKSKRTKTQ